VMRDLVLSDHVPDDAFGTSNSDFSGTFSRALPRAGNITDPLAEVRPDSGTTKMSTGELAALPLDDDLTDPLTDCLAEREGLDQASICPLSKMGPGATPVFVIAELNTA